MTVSDHDDLIEHLRGIRKVVINACHGGFSLSHDAILLYHRYSGTQIYWRDLEPSSSWSPRMYHLDPECTDALTWSDHDLLRDDPVLVRVVEELGGDAAGSAVAVLKVVRIPANVSWIIQDYDGLEWVAERHQTWS
jgi:hypothetical protein